MKIIIACALVFILSGCSLSKAIVLGIVPTTFTEIEMSCENGVCTMIGEKAVIIESKSDAVVKYSSKRDGSVIVEIDNRGATSFGRAMAEKVVDNSEFLVGTGVDMVEKD